MKKQKLKNLLKIAILSIGFLILLWNCQKDEDHDHDHNHESIENDTSQFLRVSINDLLQTDNTFSKLSNNFIPTTTFSNKNSSAKTNSNDLIITSDTINVVEKENYKSYTIRIKRKGYEFDTENLIIEQNNGIENAYILSYDFKNDWIIDLTNGISSPPKGKVYYTKLNNSTLNSKTATAKSSGSCYYITITVTIPCVCKNHYYRWQCEGCPRGEITNYNYKQLVCGGGGSEFELDSPLPTTDPGPSIGGGGGTGSSGSGNASTTNTNLEDMKEFVEFKLNKLIKNLKLNTEQAKWVGENAQKSLDIYDFVARDNVWAEGAKKLAKFAINENWSYKAKTLTNNTIAILNNSNLSESQQFQHFSSVYDNFDPLLPQDAQVSEYEAKIKKSIQYFRWYGNEQAEEFADYLESLLPLNDGFSQEDYYSLYKTIRVQTKSLVWDYVRSIVGVTIESFKPVIELALWEVGGGLAFKMLSKLPVKYLTTPIKNVITRLASSSSQAFSKLKHAKKYGIQSYKNLKTTFDDLGLSLSSELVERHHLIEKRFVEQMKHKLGNNTDDWLCIIVEKTNKLTASEHYKFTQAWQNAIGINGKAGSTGFHTTNATYEVIITTARDIYKDYPEILKALGI